jgi:hypothetical protein
MYSKLVSGRVGKRKGKRKRKGRREKRVAETYTRTEPTAIASKLANLNLLTPSEAIVSLYICRRRLPVSPTK